MIDLVSNEASAIPVGSEAATTMHVYGGEKLRCHTFQPRDEGGFRRERSDLRLD